MLYLFVISVSVVVFYYITNVYISIWNAELSCFIRGMHGDTVKMPQFNIRFFVFYVERKPDAVLGININTTTLSLVRSTERHRKKLWNDYRAKRGTPFKDMKTLHRDKNARKDNN